MTNRGITTTWSDWARMKEAGWKTARVETDDLGRVSLYSIPPEGYMDPSRLPMDEPIKEPLHLALPGTTPPRPRPRPKGIPAQAPAPSALTGRLQLLQAKAWKQIGKPATLTLNNGLRLDLVAEASGTYRLLLARQGVSPGEKELETVLGHWPGERPEVSEPEHFEHGDWHCIKVTW